MTFSDCLDYDKPLSLYVHIPFCRKKCSYCGFFSEASCNNETIENYVNRIVSEITEITSKMNKKPFYTAFIGGGNPGILSVEQLTKIADTVCKNGRPVEFTVEMNPENLSENHFFLFDSYFTRLSMGIQSFSNEALKFLGRNSSLNDTLQGIYVSQKLKKQTGIMLNYDLITCLPQWHNSKEDLLTLLKNYSCDHISLYSLTAEENTPLYKHRSILPNSDEQADILCNLWNLLQDYGFKQYEVSNFAKDNKISIHNSVYWNYQQYIGIGAGAASTGFVNSKTYRIEGSHNNRFWTYNIQELSLQESMEEFIIMGLRHSAGLNLTRLKSSYNKEIKSIPSGFFIQNEYLKPTSSGLLTADSAALQICSEL